ncbi:MAG: PEP-CTERM sorting domain-containing protein, partial [Undibacterium sp.]|nr:PEP-CTERM sorting domain-containing protein [Opitutaceae bacterium]
MNNFDQNVGAGSGKNVNGGQPHESLGFGTTATFVFQFADFNDVTGFLGNHGVSLKWQGLSTNNPSDEAHGVLFIVDTPPVPEPSTYGLRVAATLPIGALLRRRNRLVTVPAAPPPSPRRGAATKA